MTSTVKRQLCLRHLTSIVIRQSPPCIAFHHLASSPNDVGLQSSIITQHDAQLQSSSISSRQLAPAPALRRLASPSTRHRSPAGSHQLPTSTSTPTSIPSLRRQPPASSCNHPAAPSYFGVTSVILQSSGRHPTPTNRGPSYLQICIHHPANQSKTAILRGWSWDEHTLPKKSRGNPVSPN